MKKCCRCQQLLDESMFPRNRSHITGRHSYCCECDHVRRCKTAQGKIIHENRLLAQEGKKRCHRCGEVKPLGDFYIRKQGKSAGKPRSECQECSRTLRQGEDYRKAYLQEQERLALLAERGLGWCTSCKQEKPVADFYVRNGKPRSQCRECCLKFGMEVYHKDIDVSRKKGRIKCIKHQKRMKEYARLYLQTPEGRASKRKNEMTRRAREVAAVTENYKGKIAVILKGGLFVCAYCRLMYSSNDLTLDHVIPLSRGGSDTWDNLRPACSECNQAKGTRSSYAPYADDARYGREMINIIPIEDSLLDTLFPAS